MMFREYKEVAKQVADLREMAANKADAEMSELAARPSRARCARPRSMQLLEALKDEFVAAEDNAVDSFFRQIRAALAAKKPSAVRTRPVSRCTANIARQTRWRFDVSDFLHLRASGFKEVIVNIKGNGATVTFSSRRRASRAGVPKPKPRAASTPALRPSPCLRKCRT